MQTETHYIGMVVTKKGGTLLADLTVHGRPLCQRPRYALSKRHESSVGKRCSSPQTHTFRGHHQWRELFPVLKKLGIEVSVERKLPKINEAYRDYLQDMREEQRAVMTKPYRGTD